MIAKIVFAFSVLLAGLLLLIMLSGAYQLAYIGKIFPGVKVLNLNLGGQTAQAAKVRVQNEIDRLNVEQAAVSLSYEGFEWHILKADIAFTYLPEATILEAVGEGRKSGFIENNKQRLSSLINGKQIQLAYVFDKELLESKVASIAAEIDIPAIKPEVKLIKTEMGKGVVVDKGEFGVITQQEALIEQIEGLLANAKAAKLEIPVKVVDVKATEKQLVDAKAKAEKLTDKKVVITTDEQKWEMKADELIGFLGVKEEFNEENLTSYIKTIAEAVDRPAQDATFQYVGGRVTEFRAAKDGLLLNQKKAVNQLKALIIEAANTDKPSSELRLPIKKSSPKIALEEVNNLGIKELLGKGVSRYKGSIPGRVHNVGLSARRISGVLVAPGEMFSFNRSVGEISGATGYKSAYVIRSGATVLDDGGGVCQTSTTVFRAALNAGLPIVERKAHSYRVGYYEQNAKPGLDATIYSPSVDLKFKNDTPGYILVQSTVNQPTRTLTVEIYGTSDGRKAMISNHRVWDVVPAPPPRYQDDPTLPAGTIKQVDYAAAGAKAKFDYVVTRGGETLFSKTFYSNFRPWQAVYLRGV